jgi:hypothetical protein
LRRQRRKKEWGQLIEVEIWLQRLNNP